MSSPRTAYPFDATIHRQNEPVGAMLLPLKEPSKFIEQFNRIYARIGLSIQSSEATAPTDGKVIAPVPIIAIQPIACHSEVTP